MSNRAMLMKDSVTGQVLDGEYPTAPIFLIKPTAQRSASTANLGWKYRRRYSITNGATEALINFPYALDIGNTQAIVSATKAQADADDLRVWSEGVEIGRVVVDFNAASFTTLVWVIIKNLPPGGVQVFDVVYGNSVATAGPSLIPFSERPPFDTTTAGTNRSTNAKWVYNVIKSTNADAGKGAWPLSTGTAQPDYNFAAPGSWSPDNTKGAVDDHMQDPYSTYVVSATTYYQAMFKARRARGGSSAVIGRLGGDGVSIHVPTEISSVRCDFKVTNFKVTPTATDAIGKLVVLGRRVMGQDWFKVYENTTVNETEATVATATYTFPSGTKDAACAVWPLNDSVVDFGASGDRYIEAYWNSVLEVNLNSSLITQATVESEIDIYELGETLMYGSTDGTGEYQAIRLGNYLQASGAGTPRMSIKLNDYQLLIDNDTRRVDIYNSGLTAIVETVSPASYQVIQRTYKKPATDPGLANPDTNYLITNDQDWIQISPWSDVIPNPGAEVNATGWLRGSITAGVTEAAISRSTSSPLVGAGMFVHNISANSAGVNAESEDIIDTLIPIGGRKSTWFGFTYTTTNVNVQPTPSIWFYEANGSTLISKAQAADWTIAGTGGTGYRAAFSALVPAGAKYAKIGITMRAKTAAATGTVNTDQFIVEGPEVTMLRVNAPAAGMVLNFRAKSRYAYA